MFILLQGTLFSWLSCGKLSSLFINALDFLRVWMGRTEAQPLPSLVSVALHSGSSRNRVQDAEATARLDSLCSSTLLLPRLPPSSPCLPSVLFRLPSARLSSDLWSVRTTLLTTFFFLYLPPLSFPCPIYQQSRVQVRVPWAKKSTRHSITGFQHGSK